MRDLARRVVLAKAMDGSHCWLSPPPPGDNAPLHHRRCCSAKTRRWRRGLTTANSARCKLPAPMCDRACRTATDTLTEPVLSLRKVPSVQHVFCMFSSGFLHIFFPRPLLARRGRATRTCRAAVGVSAVAGGSQCSCRRGLLARRVLLAIGHAGKEGRGLGCVAQIAQNTVSSPFPISFLIQYCGFHRSCDTK